MNTLSADRAVATATATPTAELSCDQCGRHDASEVLRVGARRLMACAGCGLVRLQPRPTAAELDAVYAAGAYYTTLPPEHARGVGESIRAAVLRTFWGYPNGGRASAPAWRLLLRPLKTRVMPVEFPRGLRVLDVGCGNGQRLAELERYGHRSLDGVEPTAGAAAAARESTNARIFHGVLEDAGYPDAAFGLVILNQVLEHVPSPMATLRELHRILSPGGRLYLTVPNFGSLEARVFGEHWAGLRLPEHLHHFTPGALRQMLESTGYRIEVWRTDTLLSVSRESLGNWSKASLADSWRAVAEKCLRWCLPLPALAADAMGAGQMLRVVARKPE